MRQRKAYGCTPTKHLGAAKNHSTHQCLPAYRSALPLRRAKIGFAVCIFTDFSITRG
ncbi:MAG: hypothetical protein ACI308_05425 [Muribaculaceae bacterium]